MMKECKQKNIVAFFGSYHRCFLFTFPEIVDSLKYFEFAFHFPGKQLLRFSFTLFSLLYYIQYSFCFDFATYPGPGHVGNSLSREIRMLLSLVMSTNSSRGTPRCSQASQEI